MKHISFDQSTVLNEYAKIMHKDGLMKTAEADLYDITGETGKDLVDKAHPGGGTKTELTHSKTDENLVETIVEQQDKDVEVAKSVPKGTYATLVHLYNDLHKMGHKDLLAGLLKTIKSIATKEDILKHALTSLADKLDKKGFTGAADEIDEMLGKKIAYYGDSWLDYVPTVNLVRYFGRSKEVVAELIMRLDDIDTTEGTRVHNFVQGWMKDLGRYNQQLAAAAVTSADPKEQAAASLKNVKIMESLHNYLKALSGQWNQIKGQTNDWTGIFGSMGDVGEVTQAIQNATNAMSQYAPAATSEMQQAATEVGEEVGKDLAKPVPTKEDESGVAAKKKARVTAWQEKYNKVLGLEKGDPGWLKPDGYTGGTRGKTWAAMKEFNKAGNNWTKLKENREKGVASKSRVPEDAYTEKVKGIAEKLSRVGYKYLNRWAGRDVITPEISASSEKQIKQMLNTIAIRSIRSKTPFTGESAPKWYKPEDYLNTFKTNVMRFYSY